MNIRFHNLGKIQETELDLKPLTVIIGPNNTNKTYIAYSVYGLLASVTEAAVFSSFPFQKQPDGSISISVTDLYAAFIEQTEKLISSFIGDLTNFYQDSTGSLFADTRYEVALSLSDFEYGLDQVIQNMATVKGLTKFRFNRVDDNLTASPWQEILSSYEHSGTERQMRFPSGYEEGVILGMELRRALFPRPFLLPAERNAFVITYKVLANRRLKLLLDAQRRLFSTRNEPTKRQLDLLREAGEVRYPQPIEDFLQFLFDIESETNPTSNNEAKVIVKSEGTGGGFAKGAMGHLAEAVEMSIQNGNRINFRPTALGGQEIMVDVGSGLNIDLYNASSSIKQLAPLVLYLRHRAASGDLLIIDEPEMNLHPESQAKLLEILTILVNHGVYVLLTTHSPYLLSHLNNLALAEPLDTAERTAKAESLYLKYPDSLLNMDQISAYEMKDNQLVSLKDPDYGIRWDTLSDVSADLQQKYFQVHG